MKCCLAQLGFSLHLSQFKIIFESSNWAQKYTRLKVTILETTKWNSDKLVKGRRQLSKAVDGFRTKKLYLNLIIEHTCIHHSLTEFFLHFIPTIRQIQQPNQRHRFRHRSPRPLRVGCRQSEGNYWGYHRWHHRVSWAKYILMIVRLRRSDLNHYFVIKVIKVYLSKVFKHFVCSCYFASKSDYL